MVVEAFWQALPQPVGFADQHIRLPVLHGRLLRTRQISFRATCFARCIAACGLGRRDLKLRRVSYRRCLDREKAPYGKTQSKAGELSFKSPLGLAGNLFGNLEGQCSQGR